jgi:hypothetical protein
VRAAAGVGEEESTVIDAFGEVDGWFSKRKAGVEVLDGVLSHGPPTISTRYEAQTRRS